MITKYPLAYTCVVLTISAIAKKCRNLDKLSKIHPRHCEDLLKISPGKNRLISEVCGNGALSGLRYLAADKQQSSGTGELRSHGVVHLTNMGGIKETDRRHLPIMTATDLTVQGGIPAGGGGSRRGRSDGPWR